MKKVDWDKPVEWVTRGGDVKPVTLDTNDECRKVISEWGPLFPAEDGDLRIGDGSFIRNVTEPEAIVGELASFDGPTLRDQLAMAALTGFLSFGAARLHPCERMAKDAYQVADAMMEARNA